MNDNLKNNIKCVKDDFCIVNRSHLFYMRKIKEHIKNHIIVRGAKMRCSNGTHPRQINLPTSHGSYVKGKPVMNKGDNVVDKNISYFGICKKCTQGEDIYLLDEKGVQLPPGKKCLVQIIDEWQNVKDDTLVEGKPALINDSYLICSLYEGKITFETDGQEEK